LYGSETILLVEDEEAVRTVTQRILERNGYRVLVAQSPGDALLLQEQETGQVHLLLTDVVMPRMSGVELAARLLERWPSMKILYMSGYTDSSMTAHDVPATSASFMQKPFTSEMMARKVRTVLDGERGPASR
jgi:DNA-binding NtrC family response regulator